MHAGVSSIKDADKEQSKLFKELRDAKKVEKPVEAFSTKRRIFT